MALTGQFKDTTPPVIERVSDWRDQALCSQVDPDLFFPELGTPTTGPRRVCSQCPVASQCLDWAIDNDIRHGMWGNKSPAQRRAIARARGKSAA